MNARKEPPKEQKEPIKEPVVAEKAKDVFTVDREKVCLVRIK